jgi:hypothetical protein
MNAKPLLVTSPSSPFLTAAISNVRCMHGAL